MGVKALVDLERVCMADSSVENENVSSLRAAKDQKNLV
ncbi:MAG: hypothetical protein JWM16_1682 [Verrucomicrobiales bacterium]|nr:hypothetical protein [Verrucomicrobiales bacterium]